jgi:hypothetical protein
MKRQTQFQSENILMSVLGHLVLVALLLISFSVVFEHAKLVTPNRIQIVEIDLKNVKISGDETKLQNTTVPDVIKEEKSDKKAEIKQSIQDEKIEIKQPTVIENETKTLKKETTKKSEQKDTEQKPLPRKKTVVRVNREVLSLDRTMTVSVVDALRVALTRCWNIDTSRPDISDMRLTAHLKMLPTGVVDRIWFESESRAETDPSFAYVLDTVKAAIRTCSPFSMLPRGEFDKWKNMTLTFYPSQGKIM